MDRYIDMWPVHTYTHIYVYICVYIYIYQAYTYTHAFSRCAMSRMQDLGKAHGFGPSSGGAVSQKASTRSLPTVIATKELWKSFWEEYGKYLHVNCPAVPWFCFKSGTFAVLFCGAVDSRRLLGGVVWVCPGASSICYSAYTSILGYWAIVLGS